MRRFEKWLSDEPRHLPAEIACFLARDRSWSDEQRRLIGTHPEWPDAAYLLELSEEVAHAFVLVLSRLPASRRRGFADAFYGARERPASLAADERGRLALAAAAVLYVVDIVDDPDLLDERMLDLLQGAAQGDDLTQTPRHTVDGLYRTIAQIRAEREFDDPSHPRGNCCACGCRGPQPVE